MKIKKLNYALYATAISLGASIVAPTATWATNPDCEVIDVNDVCYDDYGSALASIASDWGTYNVTLHQDIVDESTDVAWFIANYTNLNLNGHTLTTGRSFSVYAADLHITGTGTIVATGDYAFNLFGYTEPDDDYPTDLIVDSGVTIRSNYNQGTYVIRAASRDYKYNINVDFNGRIEKGENSAWVSAFAVNGMMSEPVNINVGSNATIDVDFGAYLAGNTNMTYSGTMNARQTGIEIRNGNLDVTGGVINVPNTTKYAVNPNGNGYTTTGAAIAIAQHTTKMPISVNISGGIFNASVPFSEANPQENPAEDIAKVSGTITGGAFTSSTDRAVVSEDFAKFISGGVYNIAPAEGFITDGYTAYLTGNNYRVLPIADSDAEDDTNPDGSEESAKNTEVLSDVASSALAGILANYDTLENTEYTFENGLKVNIENAEALKSAIANGKKISIKLVKSDGDITDTLPAEEVAALYAAKAEGSSVLGIYDYSIVLVADTDDVLARVTELADLVTLSFNVSSAPAVADGYERAYQVIQYHNGIASQIGSEYDASMQILKVSGNTFSSFLIAHTDTAAEADDVSEDVAGLPNTGANGKTGSITTATSSSTMVAFSAIALFTGLFTANTVRNKIRRTIYRK
ncbi:hypothetical protein IKG54_00700 [Candidatus Saccharibacteria bacterium]|nr:hypothetical protein [Candidatus Saccharibacteria bacterium]